MSFRLRIAFAVLWLLCSCALKAQIGFSMPFINAAAPGSTKNITIKVTNFDSIVSMQYVIRWNPAVLKYSTIDNFTLPALDILDFNVQHALDSGYVRLLWEGPNSFPGVTAPDGTTIFRLRFMVIGPDTSSTPVKFTEITNTFPSIDFEVVKVSGNGPNGTITAFDEHDCTLVNGFVAVGFTVAAGEPAADDALELSISPNPFRDGARAAFYLREASDVQAVITDAAGRVVYKNDMQNLPSGTNSIDIDKAVFQSKGAYFLTIRTGSQQSIRPMLCY